MRFDFEKFKRETQGRCSVLVFRNEDEHNEFIQYLDENQIGYSSPIKYYSPHFQIYWNEDIKEVWATLNESADILFIEHFIIFPLSEEELLNFIKN